MIESTGDFVFEWVQVVIERAFEAEHQPIQRFQWQRRHRRSHSGRLPRSRLVRHRQQSGRSDAAQPGPRRRPLRLQEIRKGRSRSELCSKRFETGRILSNGKTTTTENTQFPIIFLEFVCFIWFLLNLFDYCLMIYWFDWKRAVSEQFQSNWSSFRAISV